MNLDIPVDVVHVIVRLSDSVKQAVIRLGGIVGLDIVRDAVCVCEHPAPGLHRPHGTLPGSFWSRGIGGNDRIRTCDLALMKRPLCR